jgi:peptide chain release factor subunit 1
MEEHIYKLKKLISELEKIKGRHTELVSFYISAESNLLDAVIQIRNEQGTASNIKSKSTRKNVVDALEKILQHMKLYKQVPSHGLIFFCGNVSEHEGVADMKIWAIEPPEKLEVKKYWCDQKFILEPLQDMVSEKELYGLVVMDTKEAYIGLLRGKKIIVLRKLESIVPGKTSKGGQSSQRYERVREGLVNDWYKKIAENIREQFSQKDIKGIILGGPGPSKNEFYDEDYLMLDVKKKILGVKDVGYTDEHGLEELVERSQDLLKEAAVSKEKELLQKFFEELKKESGTVTYGEDNVKDALENGAVQIILISESLEDKLDEFKDLAKQYGTEIEIISRDTREGEQFFQIGGIGAVLRWKYKV